MTVHIIGGGLAGLAAALECARLGLKLVLYEAAPDLGGRARSYDSNDINTRIDNGAHAVLSNNQSIQRYLQLCGSAHELTPHGAEGLTFCDVRTRSSWRLKFPAALWSAAHRPPGVSTFDLLSGLKLFTTSAQRTAAEALHAPDRAVEALWEPLCTAVLNTPLAEASAADLAVVLKAMAQPGGVPAGLLLPRRSLTDTYIAPAQTALQRRGIEIRTGTPLRHIEVVGDHVTALRFDDLSAFQPHDAVILALPPWSPVLADVGLTTDVFTYAPIVNAHFKLSAPVSEQFTGLIGGQGQWLLVRDGIASVTISAADTASTQDHARIAQTLWAEVAPLLQQPPALPPFHVIKERRATLRHRPGLNAHRPSATTRFTNLFLAGDWTRTNLPCTLESAVQSGFAAAQRARLVLKGI